MLALGRDMFPAAVPIRRLCAGLFVTTLLLWSGDATAHKALFPRPQRVRYGTGVVPIRGLHISLPANSSPEDRSAAQELAAFLNIANGGGPGPSVTFVLTGDAAPLPLPG